MKSKIIAFVLFILSCTLSFSQTLLEYYENANGKKGRDLYIALYEIISNHTSETYSALWNDFIFTDKKANGKVWDIYSDIPNGTPPYEYAFVTNQCGNYHSEGDCYNREHSMPKSWFNDAYPMYTDLFHLYPTDGWVNNKRDNYPYGEVNFPAWTSLNGSKLGNCSYSGYSGTAFEPVDAFKGDLARTYFYMSTCYYNKNLSYDQGAAMFAGSQLKPWALEMLISWHHNDAVDQKEIDRNNAVYGIQHNRNPFIDFPELVDKIWGNDSINIFSIPVTIFNMDNYKTSIFPNPANNYFNITSINNNIEKVFIYNIVGKLVMTKECSSFEENIDCSNFESGIYFVKIVTLYSIKTIKLIKS